MIDRHLLRKHLANGLGMVLTPALAAEIESRVLGAPELPPGDCVTADANAVFDFVSKLTPIAWSAGMAGIGQVRNGRLTAGGVFFDWNGTSLWCHIASDPAGPGFTRPFLRAFFSYPFAQLRAEMLLGVIEESNVASMSLARHIGCTVEARLPGAGRGGCDLLIHSMKRKECRYV